MRALFVVLVLSFSSLVHAERPQDTRVLPIATPNGEQRHSDVDCDGISDREEAEHAYEGGARTDPALWDSDLDGLADGAERGRVRSLDPRCGDVALDADPATTTSPVSADTDGDGMSDGAEDANRDGELSAGESDPRIDDASAHPMLPEPLLFDLVRGLGAHRGELEANTLVTLGRGPVHYAPEVEWVFANGHAVELELPMHGTSLDAVKVALQGTLHRRADGRFVHGWQAFTQIGVHTRDRGVVTTWIASGTIGARGSYVLMVGAGATIQAQGPALGTVIVNASVFRALDTHTRVGVEATTSSDVLGRTRVVATLLPQVHIDVTPHVRLQGGLGAALSRNGAAVQAASRFVVEF